MWEWKRGLSRLGIAFILMLAGGGVAGAESPVAELTAPGTPVVGSPAQGAPVAATPAPPVASAPVRVRLGLFLTQLGDFDLPKHTFSAAFWAWFLYTDEKYKPIETVEVAGARSTAGKYGSVTVKEDVLVDGQPTRMQWAQARYVSTIAQDWDITHFPFDRQRLQIDFEDALSDASQVILVPDSENSRVEETVRLAGWKIESFTLTGTDRVYNTTYGDPTLTGTSTYSRVTATIVVKRDGFRLLCSMFIGFFVAFLLVMLTYFLDTDFMAGSRIGLCGGAIFAAVGNKYVVDNYLPPASNFTLADAIEATTFAAIVFSILIVVTVRPLREKHPRLAFWINFGGATLNAIGYLGVNGWMIWHAVG